MTAFGKILAFLNLMFALLTAGLIGMVYLTRTNWYQAYTQVQSQAVAANASYQQLLKAEMAQTTAKEQQATQAKNEKTEIEKQLATAKTEMDQVKAQLEAVKRNDDGNSENVKKVTAEIERRRNEVKQLNDTLMARETRIRDLESQLTIVRDEAVNNKLKYDQLKERNDNLMTLYENASRELASARNRGYATSSDTTVKRPPPDQVRGTVKAVDGGLATISVGSDSGVNKDNILYVYRVTPKPEYLGKLTILSVTPFEAVGRFESVTRQAAIKVGDEVASQIMQKK